MSVLLVSEVRPFLDASAQAGRSLLWSEALRAFLSDLRVRGYSSLTLRDYHGDIAQLSTLVQAAPTEIGPAHLDEAFLILRRANFGPAVLRRKRAAHHCFLQFLGSRGRVEPLCVQVWKRLPEIPAADRVLFGLVMATGARLIELPYLEGRDIRLRGGEVVIRSGFRILPLHHALRDIFTQTGREVPLVPYRPVLPGANGFPVNPRTMHARFRRVAHKLGHPKLRPDDLRRDVAAQLVALGTPHGLVSAFLARDRGRPVAPRKGRFIDLSCIAPRLEQLPF